MKQSVDVTLLPMAGGLRVCVPDQLSEITRFVLEEQEDWFEPERAFLARVLLPGDGAIDAGANYGVYALTFADAVGPQGRVRAFEPAPPVADCLEISVSANDFAGRIDVVRCAVSDRIGEAEFRLGGTGELGSLHDKEGTSNATVRVALTTLDESGDLGAASRLAVLKIDVEGEEEAVLRGASKLIARDDPLVMFEWNAGPQTYNVGAVAEAYRQGLSLYRLLVSMGTLIPVPVATPDTIDFFTLNLFASSRSCSGRLAARGLLVESLPSTVSAGSAAAFEARMEMLPYALRLLPAWDGDFATTRTADGAASMEAMRLHAEAFDAGRTLEERVGKLRAAAEIIKGRQWNGTRLSTAARILADFGERKAAYQALQRLVDEVSRVGGAFAFDEPFLAPGANFDRIDPENRWADWLLGGATDCLVKLRNFSSFFGGADDLRLLQAVQSLGFADAEIDRRTMLLRRALGL
ncbi:MAG: FkbM family methyltransferase [Burkholderiales bacterium]|nr:FkbM family methyltransferase [Burkholderiales bacterium]